MAFEIDLNIYHKVPKRDDLYNKYPEVECFLFDMDGTIIDTEYHHSLAFSKAILTIENIEIPVSEITNRFLGMSDPDVYMGLLKEDNILTTTSLEDFIGIKNKLLLTILDNEDLSKFVAPGILDLIKDLAVERSIGLVTASEKIITQKILSNINILNYFDTIVTREDTEFSKPFGDPYLLAMNKLEHSPAETIVFEDSFHGISAAKTARVKAIIQASWFEANLFN